MQKVFPLDYSYQKIYPPSIMPAAKKISEKQEPDVQRWRCESAAIEQYWYFKQLCEDLAQYKCTKTKELTYQESQILKGVLLGYNPKAIKSFLKPTSTQNDSSKHSPKQKTSTSVNVTLSRDLAPLLSRLVYDKFHSTMIDNTRSRIPFWLECAGYRRAFMPFSPRLHGYEGDPLDQQEASSSILKTASATDRTKKTTTQTRS
jgi:hypothetical protein